MELKSALSQPRASSTHTLHSIKGNADLFRPSSKESGGSSFGRTRDILKDSASLAKVDMCESPQRSRKAAEDMHLSGLRREENDSISSSITEGSGQYVRQMLIDQQQKKQNFRQRRRNSLTHVSSRESIDTGSHNGSVSTVETSSEEKTRGSEDTWMKQQGKNMEATRTTRRNSLTHVRSVDHSYCGTPCVVNPNETADQPTPSVTQTSTDQQPQKTFFRRTRRNSLMHVRSLDTNGNGRRDVANAQANIHHFEKIAANQQESNPEFRRKMRRNSLTHVSSSDISDCCVQTRAVQAATPEVVDQPKCQNVKQALINQQQKKQPFRQRRRNSLTHVQSFEPNGCDRNNVDAQTVNVVGETNSGNVKEALIEQQKQKDSFKNRKRRNSLTHVQNLDAGHLGISDESVPVKAQEGNKYHRRVISADSSTMNSPTLVKTDDLERSRNAVERNTSKPYYHVDTNNNARQPRRSSLSDLGTEPMITSHRQTEHETFYKLRQSEAEECSTVVSSLSGSFFEAPKNYSCLEQNKVQRCTQEAGRFGRANATESHTSRHLMNTLDRGCVSDLGTDRKYDEGAGSKQETCDALAMALSAAGQKQKDWSLPQVSSDGNSKEKPQKPSRRGSFTAGIAKEVSNGLRRMSLSSRVGKDSYGVSQKRYVECEKRQRRRSTLTHVSYHKL